MNRVLSILICSITPRMEMLNELVTSIKRQCGPLSLEHISYSKSITVHVTEYENVEIIVAVDNREITTGAKRNLLMEMATGDYTVFVDDDDAVPDYYVEEILKAAAINCDCMAINGFITTNGKDEKQWFVSLCYRRWYTENNVYYRTPLHISPIRRSIACRVPYPNVSSGEDSTFSKEILPLLRTEVLIKRPLYYYKFRTNK